MKKSKFINALKIIFIKIHSLIPLFVILCILNYLVINLLNYFRVINTYEFLTLIKLIYKFIEENNFVSGILIVLFTWFIQESVKINKLNISKIKEARASFENTRITLLMFKKQLCLPYFEDWKKFFDKRENNIETKVFENMDLWRKIHSSLEEYGNFFTSWSQLNFYEQSWSEGLSFIAKHNPEYLVTFHRVYESLQDLKYGVLQRNDLIRQYKENEIYSGNISGDQQKKYGAVVDNFIMNTYKAFI